MQNKQYIEFKTKIKELGLDINFINQFIGFAEGNGSFIIVSDPSSTACLAARSRTCASRSKDHKSKDWKQAGRSAGAWEPALRYNLQHSPPQFEIIQNLRDLDLLYNIRTSIGYGSIVKRLETNRRVGVYQIIGNREGLKKLISIFNGGIRLPHKLERFKLFVKKYNEYYSENIQVIDSLCPVSTSDSWISGFTDADGNLAARIKKCRTSKIGFSVSTAITWSQKNLESLELIKEAFKIKAKVSYDKSWDGHAQGYRLGNENNQINNGIINYLNAYPLKTKKKLEFDIWCKIISLKNKKAPLTEEKLDRIKLLIEKFRQERL